MDGFNDLLENSPAFWTEDFKEGRIGFESRRIRGCSLYNPQAKLKCRGSRGFFKIGDMGIEPYTEK